MKTGTRSNRRAHQSGFSLIEMIGVLAIIAILAVVIVPKVFSTIASSRITNAVGSIASIKNSVTEFSGRYGVVPLTTNNSRIDDLLVTTGMLDSRFVVKIGTQPANPAVVGATWTSVGGIWGTTTAAGANQTGQSRIICSTSTATGPATAAGTNFQLDGLTNLPANSRVLAAVLVNVTATEARELSLKIDGDTFTQPDNTTADALGKVVYNTPTAAGLTTAYIYVTHQ
jgi:prepilin-type N-terminal cleavage/methylation domain-containing protein